MGKIAAALSRLEGQRVYIDANVFIFFLAQHSKYFPVVAPIFQACMAQRLFATTGAMAVAEVMVHPYRSGDAQQIAQVKSFFAQKDFLSIVGHDMALFDTASKLAGERKMKLIDAVHYATAVQQDCKFLLTNDHGFSSGPALEVVQLEGLLD